MAEATKARFLDDGFVVFDTCQKVLAWAQAAYAAGQRVVDDPASQHVHLRHGATWFVGVDALANETDGSIGSVPLTGPWEDVVPLPHLWHRAQLSVVYPGYPRQDPDESDGNHRFRVNRCAAHVDGLLPEGPTRRRFLREPHAFVLGVPLNAVVAAPLVVWPGSHKALGAAFRDAVGSQAPTEVDLTEPYQAARRRCFEAGPPVQVAMQPGQAVLLHRHLLHGVAPWGEAPAHPEGRMVAYFRPQFGADAWLAPN